MHTISVNDKDIPVKLTDNQLHKVFIAINGCIDGSHDWRDYAYEPPTQEELEAQAAAAEAARLKAEADEALRKEAILREKKAALAAEMEALEAETPAPVDPKAIAAAEKEAADAEKKAKKARGDKVANG